MLSGLAQVYTHTHTHTHILFFIVYFLTSPYFLQPMYFGNIWCIAKFEWCIVCTHPAAISTAALDMLAGDVGTRMSRKPEIMADAAYLILTQNSREYSGQFLIDDDVLRQQGVTDLDQYANVPGQLKTH